MLMKWCEEYHCLILLYPIHPDVYQQHDFLHPDQALGHVLVIYFGSIAVS